MILWNELRVSLDRKYLIIDVLVLELSYYDNVYLGNIIIDTLKTYSATGPSSKPFKTIEMDDETKHYRGFIDIDSVADNIFFVYATAVGDPADDTPCGMNQELLLGVAYDKYPIYSQGMKLLSLMGGCEVPNDLKDFILQNKAFEISLQTNNYPKAIEYWEYFFNGKTTQRTVKKGCGCHGILG